MSTTPTFSPEVHLAFLRNSITGEMFIAPAMGQTPAAAEANLRETYPSAAYSLQALYPATDVQRYLIELHRWPGMPSKVQPKLADLLATQRIRAQVGGLPPLNRAAAQQPVGPAGLNTMQMAQVRTIAKGMPAETQELAARLLGAAQPLPVTAAPAPAAAKPLPSAHPFAPRPVAQPVRPQGSLKEALAAMRAMNGLGATVQHSATPAAKNTLPMAEAPKVSAPAPKAPLTLRPLGQMPISRSPMASPALPASARGTMAATMAEEAAAPATPSAFAVGKVSAISVLKALRQQH